MEFTIKTVNSLAFHDNSFIKTLTLDTDAEIGAEAFNSCQSLQSVRIVKGVETIREGTFYNCSSLSDLVIPESVKSIGAEAFANNSSLKEIVIPDNVKSIGESAFQNCTSLVNVHIGGGITTIANSLFKGCTIESITIPSNVKTVGDDAFTGCTALKNLIVSDRTDRLTFGMHENKLPLFKDCPLDSVYVGGDIAYSAPETIDCSPFYMNTSLRAITFNDGENAIYPYEFYMCYNLERVQLGKGIKKVNEYAFAGCTSLRTFISQATVPPTCSKFAFVDVEKLGCKLYVPGESIDAYANATEWRDFFFIEDCKDIVTNGIEDIAADGDSNGAAKPVSAYSLSGYKTSGNAKGIQIIRMSDGSVKKVLVK